MLACSELCRPQNLVIRHPGALCDLREHSRHSFLETRGFGECESYTAHRSIETKVSNKPVLTLLTFASASQLKLLSVESTTRVLHVHAVKLNVMRLISERVWHWGHCVWRWI
jgi:hypothetical protein